MRDGRVVRQDLVNVQQALRNKKRQPPDGTFRLYKGDAVIDIEDGKSYRVSYFKASGIIALLPICEPRSFKEANEKASADAKVGKTVSFKPAAKRLKLIS